MTDQQRQTDSSGTGDMPATGVPGGANRRAHARLRAEDLKDLGARLASGAEIRLIDLSRSGAQFECDRRFLPNSTISLRLVTSDTTFVVSGRVVRSRIVRLDRGGLGYNVAVAFNELLQNLLEEVPPAPDPEAFAPEPPAMDAAAIVDEPGVIEASSDVPESEAAAFDAAAQPGSTVLTVTASLDQTSDDLRDLFNGNNW
ncbi:MAG TPA: PilZ domain-containing protein [Vicinamibacterales bacterium]|nr:PilZ domain-containing protein [Vicinamibacterales bacterium]